jgi:exopolyphosphatase/guanosine-5'-triphosphate,3'-diphosphate pyrophosphatase
MRVGIVDVGANSVRLLVAERDGERLDPVEEARAQLSLGADVEAHGRITPARRREACDVVRRYVARARKLGVDELDVFLASPGRQAENGAALAKALSSAARVAVRILTSEEEGAFGFLGATAGRELAAPVLVCDVGGGSTQLVHGDASGLSWHGGLDVGSLRLTQRFSLDRARKPLPVEKALAEVERLLGSLELPQVPHVLATGGTARALAKLRSSHLDGAALEDAIAELRKRTPKQVSVQYGLSRRRAERLLGGTLVLAALQRRIGLPLEVAAGGIREGAALALVERSVAA